MRGLLILPGEPGKRFAMLSWEEDVAKRRLDDPTDNVGLGFGAEKKHDGELDLALPPPDINLQPRKLSKPVSPPEQPHDMTDPEQVTTMERILQEITVVSRRHEERISTGPKDENGTSKPRLIIVCLLRHGQARQLLLAARVHRPFKAEGYEIRITADFSKETNDRRKGFLALRPWMRQLDVKYGLFEPARLWVTKNGVSKDFYDPEDLRLFLDSL
ncbi:hypothetical protein NDU88_004869 [Pleurodeles waltl]|uniref:Uncharacterized protein n=1 Tax=Pleurodeles waltl TaxID=8319 RepID=A0AAV7NKP3_PLEWA|nr:hypothetical protein NDU88_004869 [Pleurodeles waltl]